MDLSLNSSFKDGVQFAWDSTSIKYAEDCAYKYKLTMIDGWKPKGKSVHLLFGGWYAMALEHFYKYRAEGATLDEALVRVVREALVDTWEYDECPDCKGSGQIHLDRNSEEFKAQTWVGPGIDWIDMDCGTCAASGKLETGHPWQSDHNSKTRENLIRTIVWYVDQFSDDPVRVIHKSDGAPAVEYSFSFEADHGIVLSGHLDRLVEYAGGEYVMDQKTSGFTITPQFFEQFDPDTQMSLYTFAGQIILNRPVKGVIIDAAQIAVGFSRFMRGFTFRDDAKLDEWYNSTIWRIQQTQQMTRENFFPMNPSSCNKYMGCQFRNICNKSPHVREEFLKADYTQTGPQWDPLKRR